MSSCRSPRISAFCAAPLARGAVRRGGAARAARAGDRRPQFGRRHRPRLGRAEGDGRARDHRLPARSRRRQRAAGLSDRSPAYGRLCRLLSVGKARAGKGACHLDWNDVEEWNDGLIGMLVPDRADADASGACPHEPHLRRAAYLALSLRRRPRDAVRLRDLAAMAAAVRVATVATGDVLYHPRPTAVAGRRHLHPREMHDRRAWRAPRALRRPPPEDRRGDGAAVPTLSRRYAPGRAQRRDLAERCTFSLDQLRYQYPDEIRDAAAPRSRSSSG
jgi:DNA polymerase III alpha subunit